MRKLVWDTSFRNAFKRHIRKKPYLEDQLFECIAKLMKDPFSPSLKTHKLSGSLNGLWACRVEYDCRIIFSLSVEKETHDELITLIDIGKHDEVY